MTATLELRHIDKSFPGARALKDVSLTVESGHVHALVGENGAGKSTLIKIAVGALRPDAGTILLDGREVTLTPAAARTHGIRVVHQERQISPTRTVAENLVMDAVPRNACGLVTRRSIAREAQRRLDRVGIDLDLDVPASSLTVAQTQMLEIARAVDYDARCVVMDEPSASLHRSEVGRLFDVVRAVRASGVAVVYISHHLDEVMEVSDEYTVLRDGGRVADGLTSEVTSSQLVAAMFGAAVSLRREEVIGEPITRGDVAVRMRDVSLGAAVTGVSLDVRRGEVVVITGAVGSGTSEVGRLMSGAVAPTSGTVHIAGKPVGRRHNAARAGVAFLPSDRKRQGLMLDRSVAENLLLAEFAISRQLMFSPRSATARSTASCRELSVKAGDVRAAVRTLSGGNQQRVILARWLNVGSSVLVLDEPTVGVDIPSKFAIYRIIRERARTGSAVVILSTEYQEIRSVADRVVVMRDGRILGEIPGEDATESRIFELEMEA